MAAVCFLRARSKQDGKRALSSRPNDMHTSLGTWCSEQGADVRNGPQPFYLVYHRYLRMQPHVRAAVTAIETYMRAHS
jgi:hypothetical protein